MVPVRQYRALQSRFLHCMPHGKPACDLLIVQGLTLAHKGLAPSSFINYLPIIKDAHAGHTQGISGIKTSPYTRRLAVIKPLQKAESKKEI